MPRNISLLYPSSAANGIFSDGSAKNILLKKPDIQTATAGSFDPAANISFAESADGKTLRFENLFGLVKFRRPTTSNRNIVQATLHGNNGEKLTATSIQFPGKTLVSGQYDEEKVVLEGEITTGTDYYFRRKAGGADPRILHHVPRQGRGGVFGERYEKRSIKAGHIRPRRC